MKSRAICQKDLLEVLEDMKQLDITKNDDASVSRMKFLQRRADLISDALDEQRKDKVGKLQEQIDAKDAEIKRLREQLSVVPEGAAEQIAALTKENAELRRRAQTPIVKEVTVPDPAVLAENAALKDAVAHFVKGWSKDMKVDAILELFEENRTTAKVVTEVFCVCRWEDIVSLMAASDEMLKTHERAYKSPLAPLALSIRLRRQQKESQEQWDKNQEKPPILPVEVARELEQKIATENEVRERNAALKAKIDKILGKTMEEVAN